MIERASERAAGDFQDQLMQRLGETAEEHGGLIDTLEAQRQAAKQSADVVMRIRRIRDVSDHLPIFRAAVTARELKLKEAHGEIPWRALKIDGERVYIEVVP